MTTSIKSRDLTKEAPHSARERFGDFAILARTTDKCRASIDGKLGDYHFDCPLDNQLFSFKGINGDQFKKAVQSSKTYEDVAKWVEANGTRKSAQEIKAWSDKMDALKLTEVPTLKDPEHRKEVEKSCQKLGLNFEEATLFEWLDADDATAYDEDAHLSPK